MAQPPPSPSIDAVILLKRVGTSILHLAGGCFAIGDPVDVKASHCSDYIWNGEVSFIFKSKSKDQLNVAEISVRPCRKEYANFSKLAVGEVFDVDVTCKNGTISMRALITM